MHVRAVIPHYFQELKDGEQIQLGEGFGSRQRGARQRRSVALQRCLYSLIQQRRTLEDLVLDQIAQSAVMSGDEKLPGQLAQPISVEIIVVIYSQETCIDDVLIAFKSHLKVLPCGGIDPRFLGICARDYLIQHASPADLNLYVEDDLVIQDQLFSDKLVWFADLFHHESVLLPHRFELLPSSHDCSRLLIDGPLHPTLYDSWHKPQKNAAMGQFMGSNMIRFDCPDNPHSGFFALSKQQLLQIRDKDLPVDGFVGPLETAATLTVGQFFSVLKPCIQDRSFLWIEHACPSFLGYVNND